MFAFVTSLPHPDGCASYLNRSLLFRDTLASIMSQDDDDIHLVIVANRPPEIDLPDDPRIEVVGVSFPPASDRRSPSLEGITADKGAKLGVGTSVAIRRGAEHIMFVDSDDFIRRDIVSFTKANAEVDGWYSDSGYLHPRGSRYVRLMSSGFHQLNGSTHIFRAGLLNVPDDVDPTLSRDDVLEAVGRDLATSTMGRHRPIVEFFERRGTPLTRLPFPAAIWEIGTGENCSGALAGSGAKVPLEGAIAHDYGLAVPGRMTSATHAVQRATSRVARRVRGDRE